ncbi:MAG: LysR family transcriptional regulator [Lachnospiraceae bacterium]|nr:LysR family transcriptional regulator [Lachnospiraceae bacterium]
MAIKSLEYIVALAEEKSVSKAAARLYMAQSSLSQFLKNQEEELGTVLFNRTPGGIRLTDAGRAYVDYAYRTLNDYRQVQNQINDIEELKSGQVLFGISTFRGSYLIPRVLQEFSRVCPEVDIIISEHNSFALEELIISGKLDMALVVLPLKKATTPINFMMQDEVMIMASKDHLALQYAKKIDENSDKKYVDLEDIKDYKFLLSNHDTVLGNVAEQQFQKHKIQPIASNTNLSAQFAAAMARQGLGLAFTYRSCMEHVEDVEYLSIGKEGVFIDLGLTYPGEYRSSATTEFTKLLIKNWYRMENEMKID